MNTNLNYWHCSLSAQYGVCSIVRVFGDNSFIVKFESGNFKYVDGKDLQHICQDCLLPNCEC